MTESTSQCSAILPFQLERDRSSQWVVRCVPRLSRARNCPPRCIGEVSERGGPGLFHLGDPRFHPCGPIPDFRGVLNVMVTFDKFVDTIETQFNSDDLFEAA